MSKRKIKPNTLELPFDAKLVGWQAVAYLKNMDFDDVQHYVEEHREWPSKDFEYELWKFVIARGCKPSHTHNTKKDLYAAMTLGGAISLFYPDGISFQLMDIMTQTMKPYSIADFK